MTFQNIGVLHIRGFKRVKARLFFGLIKKSVLVPVDVEVGLAQDPVTKAIVPYMEKPGGLDGGTLKMEREAPGN